jgi:hypothetical protein
MAFSKSDKYKVSPAMIINRFLTDKFDEDLGDIWLDEDHPIFVPQEQPEDVDNRGGYIVYIWLGRPTGDLYALEAGQLSYIISHRSVANITATINYIRAHLNQWDDSATLINDWLWEASHDQDEIFEEMRKYDFKNIRVVAHMAADPNTDEGGRPDASVTLEFTYTHDGFN